MSISVETLALAKKNTKQAVEEAITSVYRYKGSVETFEDLPTSGQKVGDVYNVEKEAGRNYAWDGSNWDALGIAENLGDIEFTGADSEIKTINEDFWDKDKVQEELDDVSNDITNVSNNLSNTSNALNNSINEVSNVANAAYNQGNSAYNRASSAYNRANEALNAANVANNSLNDLGNIEFSIPSSVTTTVTKDLTNDKTTSWGVPIKAREVKDGKITIKVTNNQDMPTVQNPNVFAGGYGPTPQQAVMGPGGSYTPSLSSNVDKYIFTIDNSVIQGDYYIFINNVLKNMGQSTDFSFQGTLSYEIEALETHTINNDYYDKDDVDNLVSNISNELSNTSNTLSNNINSVSNNAANAYNAANVANSQATSAYNATNALSNTTNETFANLGNVEFNDKKIISYYPDARNIMFDANDFNNDDIIELHIDIQEASNYLSNHPECNGKLYMALFASNSTNNFENYAGQSTAGADAYFKIDLTTGVRTIPISWIKNVIKQRYFIIGSRVEYVKTSSPFKMAFTEHYLTDNSYLVYPSYSKRSIYDSYYNKIETEELVNNSKIDIGNSDFISTLTNIKDYNIETLEDNKIFIEASSNMNNVNRFLWVNTSIPVIYDNIQKQQSTEEEEWTIGTLTIDNFNEINTFIEESDYYNGFTMSIGYTYNQQHIGITDRFAFVQLYPNIDEQNFEIRFNTTLDEYITNYDVYFISFSDMMCIRKSNKAYWKYLQNPVYHFQYAEPVKHTINQDYYDKDATNSLANDTLNAAKTYTDSKFDISLKKEVVQTLPAEGEEDVLYLVPKQDSSNEDVCDEYIWTNNAWEKIGSTATDLSNYYTKTQVDSMRELDHLAISYAANTADNAYDAANAAHNSAYNANMNAGTAYSTATNAYNTANAAYNAANSASCAAWSANTNALSAANVANNALNQISNVANDLTNARNDITNAANQASCAISIATSANAVAAEGRNLANNALNDIANMTNDVSNASNLAQAAYDAANAAAPAVWQEISNVTTNEATNSITLPIDKEYDEYLITFNRPVAMDGSNPADSMTSTSGALTLSIGGTNVIGGKGSLYEKMNGTYTVENIVGNMYHATCYRNNLQGADTSYTENVVDINDVTNGGAVLATTVGSSANIASNVTITLYGKGVPTPEPDPWADYVKVNALDMVQTYNDGQYIGPFAFADFDPEETSYVFIQYQCPSVFDNKEIGEGEGVLNWNTVEPTLTESSVWTGDSQFVEKVSNNLVKTEANYQLMQDTLYNFIGISNLFSDLSKVTIMYKPINE